MIENEVDIKYCITDNTVLEIKRSVAGQIQQWATSKATLCFKTVSDFQNY